MGKSRGKWQCGTGVFFRGLGSVHWCSWCSSSWAQGCECMAWVIAQVWPWGWRALWSESRSVMSDSLQPQGLYSPWDSPGQNTGVGSLSLLQGIFPIRGSNLGLLHCRQILYQLSHRRSLLRALTVWKGNWSVWAQERNLLNINHSFPLLCKGNYFHSNTK